VAYGVMALVLFLIGFFIARNMGDEIKEFKRIQILLGTVVDIKIRDADEKKTDDAITKAFAEIKRIDDLFTTYNEDSPVWQFNHSNDSIIAVDEEIYSLMVLCDSLWHISDGGFDVAIESLIRVWGFDTKTPDVPSDDKIISALNQSDWEKLKLLDENKNRVKKKVELNFGQLQKD